ncbi:MAG: hypothetical protein ACLUSP_10590 [Christensenellales bacterium]
MPFGSLTSAFGAIAKRFDLSELDEFTVEANPDSVTHDFIREIKSVGVNRVSMGLQSASDEILERSAGTWSGGFVGLSRLCATQE